MPGGVKRNKGNKKLAAWDRLVVPSVTFRMPPDLVKEPQEIDYPLNPVGKLVIPKTIILYEISPTYIPEPKVNIYRIPFEKVIGDWSDEKLTKGYELTTVQGETLLIRWNLHQINVEESGKNNGLIIHVKNTNRQFPLYDTDWGHVFGVAIEWETFDKTIKGRNWANRIIGYTTEDTRGNIKVNISNSSPYVIRPESMLGYPAKRTIKEMGYGLPIRIFPAVGKAKTGIVLGFNENVTNYIRKPIIPYVYQNDAGDSYGDLVYILWQKDEYAVGKYTILRIKFIENLPKSIINAKGERIIPQLNVEYDLTDPVKNVNGTNKIDIFYPNGTKEKYVYEIKLYEWDENTNSPTRLISCLRRIEDWGGTPRDETC